MSSQKYKLDQVFGGREPPAMAEDLRWMGVNALFSSIR